jgi:hypothetical protein
VCSFSSCTHVNAPPMSSKESLTLSSCSYIDYSCLTFALPTFAGTLLINLFIVTYDAG